MLDLLSGFVVELRRAGLPVSLTEHLDAAEAVRHIPLEDREGLKYALAATLVKSSSHWRAFETAFEVFFAVRTPGAGAGAGDPDSELDGEGEGEQDGAAGTGDGGSRGQGRSWQGGGGGEGMTPEELAEMLFKSLLSADAALMNVVARNAVDRYAGMEPGRPVGGTYYLYRTLRNLDLEAVLAKLLGQAQAGAAGGQGLTDLEERLAADEYRARIEKFRRAVETEIRRRLVEDRGAEALARSVRKPLPEDIDVMHATRDELAVLHRVLQPLVAQDGRAPGPQAPPRPQGPARLPGHHAPVAVHRGRAHRAPLPPSPPGQARDLRHRRHLGIGGVVRPLHPAPGLRHQLAVLQGAQLRLRRRH